jgi:hypothetical protein
MSKHTLAVFSPRDETHSGHLLSSRMCKLAAWIGLGSISTRSQDHHDFAATALRSTATSASE